MVPSVANRVLDRTESRGACLGQRGRAAPCSLTAPCGQLTSWRQERHCYLQIECIARQQKKKRHIFLQPLLSYILAVFLDYFSEI